MKRCKRCKLSCYQSCVYGGFIIIKCCSGTCVDSQVHPQVTGVAEGFAAVAALVRPHAHVTHEVHVEFGGSGKGSRTHAAFKLPLSTVTLTVYAGLAVTLSLALPRRRRGAAGGLAGQLLLGVGLTMDAVSGVFLGGAGAVGVAAEVSFELREGCAFFTTVADLFLWNMGDACKKYRYSFTPLEFISCESTCLCLLLTLFALFLPSYLSLSPFLCSS